MRKKAIFFIMLLSMSVLLVNARIANCLGESDPDMNTLLETGYPQIQDGVVGKLLYDAAFLEPRTGPSIAYTPENQFDLKAGDEVQVFSVCQDSFSNQWAMVEGIVRGEKMRVYLLCYDAYVMEETIDILEKWKLVHEEAPARYDDWSYRPAWMTDADPHAGPGKMYPWIELGEDAVLTGEILVSGDWVLVEYMYEDKGWLASYTRGWVPIDSLYEPGTEIEQKSPVTD